MAYQHEKCWDIDHELVVLGSANATHNSMENCEEDAVAITEPSVVAKVVLHMEHVRARSQRVSHRMIEEVAARPRANSKGLGRGRSDSALGDSQQRHEWGRPVQFDIGSVPPPSGSRGGRTRAEAIRDVLRDEGHESRALSSGAARGGAVPGAGAATGSAVLESAGRQRAGARSSSAVGRTP